MANGKKSFTDEEALNVLYTINYSFNEVYGLSFLSSDRYNKICFALSYLRGSRYISGDEYRLLSRIFKHQNDNRLKIKELIHQEPRKYAQLFIGKQNIRRFIFKRDGYKCLRCGTSEKLTIDHIEAIYNNGENKISNLQTLCKSCNSWKSTKYIDFR